MYENNSDLNIQKKILTINSAHMRLRLLDRRIQQSRLGTMQIKNILGSKKIKKAPAELLADEERLKKAAESSTLNTQVTRNDKLVAHSAATQAKELPAL